MIDRFKLSLACGTAAAALAACGGGGSGSGNGGYGVTAPVVTPTTAATAAPTVAPGAPPTAAPQVIKMALPTSAIGAQTDPTFGLIGGYTQQLYSQVLAFVPGAQVMIANGQLGVPHTLNVVSQTGFPANPTLSTSASGGSALAAGFASGTVAGGTSIGPITLAAGTYYIGCAFHYVSNAMRTVLNVAPNATPGPQATPMPNNPAPPTNPFGY